MHRLANHMQRTRSPSTFVHRYPSESIKSWLFYKETGSEKAVCDMMKVETDVNTKLSLRGRVFLLRGW